MTASPALKKLAKKLAQSLACDLPPPPARVAVAMSGGVDSSLAAALVQAAGFDAIGLTMQLYDAGAPTARSKTCCAGQDIRDARRVAAALGMPHYVLDYEQRFHAEVIQPFADSYAAGQTPIPCINCNQRVKFVDLLELARSLGARALVTGHYIRSAQVNGKRALLCPHDLARDQSYFLFATTQEQLEMLRFPLGELEKSQVRALAAELQLGIADKPDSQDICFVPHGRYDALVARLRPDATKAGDIVDETGRVLGRHQGVMHYTVGQRRGLGLGGGEPLYVLALDAARARVVVGARERLGTQTLLLREVNWLGDADATHTRLRFRVRSTGAFQNGTLELLPKKRARVTLDAPEEGVAPGQACVFYGADAAARLYGGGWIDSAPRLAGSGAVPSNTAAE